MNNKNKRSVFFISDRTGLTAETLGRSLISQFDGIDFQRITLPYVDSVEKARAASVRIDAAAQADGVRPLVFSTMIQPEYRNILSECDGLFLDLFDVFISPLQAELKTTPSHEMGLSHGVGAGYAARMNAVNYALNHDDGGISHDLPNADIVLIGVSRCGKTPTSLYLALQFGIHAANYPLVEEDFDNSDLPSALKPLRKKLYGLTISPERLHQIRAERSPNSRYASLDNCRNEIRQAENLMNRFNIPQLDTTSISVEEIATTIVHQAGLR